MGNENARFSRRNFLKGTGVAALAMAGGALVISGIIIATLVLPQHKKKA